MFESPIECDIHTSRDKMPRNHAHHHNGSHDQSTISASKPPSSDSPEAFKTIPPHHSRRTLVLCFDGTGDQFDGDNSNVVQLFSMLKKDDSSQQMVYYQAGIGTYTSPQMATPLLTRLSELVDEIVAWDLGAHVRDGYQFLMQNYVAGDHICIFGFSRGAYTARSLAGMISKVGLLPADNFQQVPFAYKMYTRTDSVGWKQSNVFKETFSNNVPIEFLGVWDTVDSVGVTSRRLPFTTSNTSVRTFRHAVSLDERRAKFKANLWNRPTRKEAALGVKSDHVTSHTETEPNTSLHAEKQAPIISASGLLLTLEHTCQEDQILNVLEQTFADPPERPTDIEEVWFAGCHCDVGGGSVSNSTRYSLARIPLRWMIRECFRASTGIMFKGDGLRAIGLDPKSLYPVVQPRPPPLLPSEHPEKFDTVSSLDTRPSTVGRITFPPTLKMAIKKLSLKSTRASPAAFLPPHDHPQRTGTEEEEDQHDVLCPLYDQLTLKKWWWIVEVMPMQFHSQKENNKWVRRFGINLAEPRSIPAQEAGLKVHRSVKVRMDAESKLVARCDGRRKLYRPRPTFEVEPTWVD